MSRTPLPDPPATVDPLLRAYLSGVRAALEVLSSGAGAQTRRAVTFNDLVALGLTTADKALAQAKVIA